MEEFEARTTRNHQVHKQLLSGKLAAIEEMAHKQRLEHEDSDPKASSQSLQVEKRDGETDIALKNELMRGEIDLH